jgi:Na+/melibiose symporter-like transporter
MSDGCAKGWLAYPAYAVAFILARLFFSQTTDRFGGDKIALICVLIVTAGQALMWRPARPELALIGAALTRFGFSLVSGPPGSGTEP